MAITIEPLSEGEKKVLRRTFISRLIFALIFIVPGLFLFVQLGLAVVSDFMDSSYDVMSFFGLGLFVAVIFLLYKYVIPFYLNSYKNIRAKNKLIISTSITNLERRWTFKGFRFLIETEYNRIDSWAISILDQKPPFIHFEVYVGMRLEIHCLENNKVDYLRIKKI